MDQLHNTQTVSNEACDVATDLAMPFADIEPWLNAHPEQYGMLLAASKQVDLIFGAGRSKWLTVLEDWEGTRVLCLEVEFEGSGEDASRLCRRFVAEWLVNQEPWVRRSLDLGVRFV
jgi:hypothetical protein